MTNIAQMNLKEPVKTDWDTAYAGSRYEAPPATHGPDGKPLPFNGKVIEVKEFNPDQDYLNFQVDIKVEGVTRPVRTWVSTRPFTDREGNVLKGAPNSMGKFLKGSGLSAKPQTNSEYAACMRQTVGRSVNFTADWEARNSETGEKVSGYLGFPEDPARPGTKKAILRAGDVVSVLDKKGSVIDTKTITSEVLFANLRIKYFNDPTRAKGAA